MPYHEPLSGLQDCMQLCILCVVQPYGLDHCKLTGKYNTAMLCLHLSRGFALAPDYIQVEWNSTKG